MADAPYDRDFIETHSPKPTGNQRTENGAALLAFAGGDSPDGEPANALSRIDALLSN
jgi:hypothetical protein